MKEVIEIPFEAQTRTSDAHRELFSDAGEEYFDPPISSLEVGQITPSNAYDTVASLYFDKMSPERRQYVSGIVEEVHSNDINKLLDKPEAIVCIPAAAHNESPETLDRMFETLAEQDDADKFEVFLFGNYPDNIDEDKTVGAHNNISQAIARAHEKYPNMVIRHATVGYQEANMGIGAVRKDMMDVIAADAAARELEYTQPVIWIDADVTKMSKSALSQASEAIRNEASSFMYHLNPRQTVDGVEAATLSHSALPNKIAAHYEIGRRQKIRDKLVKDPSLRGDYIEESGLGFMLGNYILTGGVNAGDAVNESTWLQSNFYTYYDEATKIMTAASGKELTQDSRPTIIKYLPAARIYTSGRRLVTSANSLIGEIENGYSRYSGYDLGDTYTGFSHTEELRDSPATGPEPSKEGDEQIFNDASSYNQIANAQAHKNHQRLSERFVGNKLK